MKPESIPPQTQAKQPGEQSEMHPQPQVVEPHYKGSDKLKGKVALITGGDSGIGRSIAVYFAKEGADIAIVYLEEDKDAAETQHRVEAEGRKCILIRGDVGQEEFCQRAVAETVIALGKLSILVNNAGEQFMEEEISDVCADSLAKIFRTNVFAYFFMAKAALGYLKPGDTIVNTASVVAYRGSPKLLSYSATKGAVVTFTRSLAKLLVEKGIRVNAVAPGPIWTPFIPSSFPPEKVAEFGKETPMRRPGQPSEVAAAYVYLASDDSTFVAGQVIHVNGGEIVNG